MIYFYAKIIEFIQSVIFLTKKYNTYFKTFVYESNTMGNRKGVRRYYV